MMRRFGISNTVLLIICLMYLILYADRVNFDGRPADQGGSRPKQYPARIGFLGVRLSLCVVATARRLFRRQIRPASYTLRQFTDRVRSDRSDRRGGRAC